MDRPLLPDEKEAVGDIVDDIVDDVLNSTQESLHPDTARQVARPGAEDMKAACLLYVKLKCKWDSGAEGSPTSIEQMREALVYDKVKKEGLASSWSGLDGLRHKYFLYNKETDTISGVYVFFSADARKAYTDTDLFKSHAMIPHFSSVEAEEVDVMPGTELSIEKTAWPTTPPTAEDVTKAVMLIVKIKMNYDTKIEGCPTCKEDLYGFMAAPPNGMGYPAQFSTVKGLRGKYFGYNAAEERCYGFYTFLDQASLDEYMASDLFKKQGDPPHIAELAYTVHEVLPGTEIALDQGAWTGK